MMMLTSLLHEKKAAIVQRWLEDILASYAGETSTFLKRGRDRFANPVGHALRVGTETIFENLLEGIDSDETCRSLDGIIRVRAVQDFSASEAVSFVFLLKKVVQAELGKEAGEAQFQAELARLDADIDRVALLAFDVYMRCREQFCELRVNEIKRSVSGLMERLRRGGALPESAPG